MSRPTADPILSAADVTVIVPVGGGAPFWHRAARSLARLDPAPGEIVAVIDGASDTLAQIATEIGATILVLEDRGGPGRARNRGAERAGGEVLLFVDADVEVPPDLVARVAALFAGESPPAAVIGSYDDDPGDPGFLSQYRNLLHHFVHQTGRKQAATFWAGCGAVRRRAFLDLGGFDEGYTEPSIEDIELGSRLRRAGHEIHLVKQLQVKHLKRWRLGEMASTDLWRRAVPWTELMLGEGGLVNDLNVKTRDRISVALAFLPLAALAAAWRWPWLLAVAAAVPILLVALNASFFGVLRRRRSVLFALRAVAPYWLYLLICGVGFGLGLARHLLGRKPA
jgi:GT2 family glycosyltransferase